MNTNWRAPHFSWKKVAFEIYMYTIINVIVKGDNLQISQISYDGIMKLAKVMTLLVNTTKDIEITEISLLLNLTHASPARPPHLVVCSDANKSVYVGKLPTTTNP